MVSSNFPVPIGSPFSEIDPVILTDPVIDVSVFTLNPSVEREALIDPVDIWDRFNPVTPLAGRLYNPAPSPMYEPVKTEAETDPRYWITNRIIPLTYSLSINTWEMDYGFILFGFWIF